MKINYLARDLNELKANPLLFEKSEFNARKEALQFIKLICKLFQSSEKIQDLSDLYRDSLQFKEKLIKYDLYLIQQYQSHIIAGVRGEDLRSLLSPYTTHIAKKNFQDHYGYESLDVLLDGILTPSPLPESTLVPLSGMVRYQPSPASVIFDLLDQINTQIDDIFIDLGSGFGKVVALVYLLAGIKSIGVEIDPTYTDFAKNRATRLGLSNVNYFNTDVRDLDYSIGTIYYLFNPFGGKIFDTVFENLRQEAKNRKIFICSYGACTNYISMLPWLRIRDQKLNNEYKLAIFSNN